jgi:3-deoxy-D-manno-octulosonic-acid transferase
MKWYLGMAFLWLVYFPILTLLKGLLFFVPKVRSRMEFEKKNKTEEGCRSFKKDGLKADLCFEFSSEGEFQQVASLIDDAILQEKRLELVFFSPSVEKTIVDLHRRHPKLIRYLRYPILGLSFSSWITSSTLVLVRYDLFPEFLIWSFKAGRKLKLVWVTFKKERAKGKSISAFKMAFFLRSDFTIFATEQDYILGQELGMTGTIYDFRMEQIKRRMEKREEKFAKFFPQYQGLKKVIDRYPRQKRLIMGNAWPQDLFLLKDLPADVLLVIVPHQLRPEILEEMRLKLIELGRSIEVISDMTIEAPTGSTVLVNKKGILCELYSDFSMAYVGGGFGVSVHSILEPLVAGSEHLSCGPVNHRSTEYDIAQTFGSMKEVKTNQEFLNWLSEDISGFKVHDRLRTQIESYPVFQKEVLSC